MKIFVTGGSGLLGSALSLELVDKYELISTHYSHPIVVENHDLASMRIDITDINSFRMIEELSPEVIVHAAALTDLDLCEKDPDLAYAINVVGTKNVLQVAKRIGSKLIYICTDYIFNGEKGNYSEQDNPHPLSVYANTKLYGERIITEMYDDFVSVRTSLHGWNLNHQKPSLSSWIINSLSEGREIFLITDQVSSLMVANDLAVALIEMIEKDLTGIYHVASANSVSRYKFALEVAEVFNLNSDLIKPISFESFIKKYSPIARHPKNVSLDISKIEKELGGKMPTVLEGILHMKEKEEEFKKKVRCDG